MKRVIIIGATSAIAEATARLFAADGDRLFLVARDQHKLDAMAADLTVRGASRVETSVLEATDFERHSIVIDDGAARLGGLDIALIAYDTLPDQKACEQSADMTRREMETNCLTQIVLLTQLANRFEHQRSGTLAVVSSVAGDRGRESNYV